MNLDWKNFLLNQGAICEDDGEWVFLAPKSGTKAIYPISHLGVLTVFGEDAAKFLQGQITCNINDITETNSSLGALCNAKGRVVTTFLLVKHPDGFLLILPQKLLLSVQKRLQLYIMRSKVSLSDSSDHYCLMGLGESEVLPLFEPTFTTQKNQSISVDLQGRKLIIAQLDEAQAFWMAQLKLGFYPENSANWCYLDVISGLPWLSPATSEQFIPQMLNLDKLGGISFTKGCYIGQEIVARTHYLGKVKRALFLAEYNSLETPKPNTSIIDENTESAIGNVLVAQDHKMLVVLQRIEDHRYNLRLDNPNRDKITLLTTFHNENP